MKKPITFERYLKGPMTPKTKLATADFFSVVHKHRGGATGKSFLLNQMAGFLESSEKSFQAYLFANGVSLLPWQKEAADIFFDHVKTIGAPIAEWAPIVNRMIKFVDLHGNEFEV